MTFTRVLSSTSGVFVWLLYILLYHECSLSSKDNDIYEFIYYAAIFYSCAGYVLVFTESIFSSKEAKYLRKTVDHPKQGGGYLNTVVCMQPSITLHMESYHMEKQVRTSKMSDSSGHITYYTETFDEEVVTWSGQEEFHFKHWKDISQIHASVERASPCVAILRVALHGNVILEDRETEEDLKAQKAAFVAKNKHRDQLHREWTKTNIPGLKKHFVHSECDHYPFWMNFRWFIFFALVHCSWPFRIMMHRRTQKASFEIIKSVTNTNDR